MSQVAPEVEYEQKWQYLRHIEESRRKGVQLFFLLLGGIGSYLATVRWEPGAGAILAVIGVLLILSVYAVFLLYFLIFQKVEYRRHLTRIDALDGCSMTGEEEATDPFPWFFGAVLTTGATVFGVFVGALVFAGVTGASALGGWLEVERAAVAAGVVIGVGAAIGFWSFFQSVLQKYLVEGKTPVTMS